ncbi:hypothetical protein GQ602_001071 [Ophiocordyceps camponoti-floridani]|uniref:Uncharacterized protein n=1 Tax=Ophiocordyceps camponoti-floridani TaxID=2030778 RepID=A0A8H4QDD1_9HYPO|nr:hypothetical protein GQ602_001071 [Ophiocordyceps camponoti-floridani]
MATHGTGGLVGFRSEPNCGRGTVGILWSCFSTIALSMWASLHLDLLESGIEMRIGMFVGCLLIPEAGVAAATDEYATALYWRDRIRAFPGWESWSLKHSFLVRMGGVVFADPAVRGPGSGSRSEHRPGTPDDDDDNEKAKPYYLTLPILLQLIKEAQPDHTPDHTPAVDKSDGRVSTQPPLQHIRPDMFPSTRNINQRAKTDAMVKVLALLQALWFAANVIFRLVVGIGLSLLETMTVAYVLCGIFLFILWFAKPQGLEEPFDLPISMPAGPKSPASERADPRSRAQVARLTTGILLVALFSATHLAAWNYPFPSVVETWLWRGSVIASWVLASLPVLNPVLPVSWYSSPGWYGSFGKRLIPFLATPYLIARLITFALVFTAFRAVPSSVYEKPSWSSYWVSLSG